MCLMNGIIVGIRAGNCKVMGSNELHSSRSINTYPWVHTLCMSVWLMYKSIWDMWMVFVNSVYVRYVWHVCTVCMICVQCVYVYSAYDVCTVCV